MSHPPYHLRQNKAVDRFLFLEALRRISTPDKLNGYVYYGLGGSYLEDFRILHEMYPELSLVSIEREPWIYKRQKFHRPCSRTKFVLQELRSFLAQTNFNRKTSIVWLDYTDLHYTHIEDFSTVLDKVTDDSIVKITLSATPSRYNGSAARLAFENEFQSVWPAGWNAAPNQKDRLAELLLAMLHIAAEKTLPASTERMLQPISAFRYSDGNHSHMLTFTGVVCARRDSRAIRARFADWKFANLNWRKKPLEIDVPYLSARERLHLQSHLPCYQDAGRTLRRHLGHDIETTREKTLKQLWQYSDFYNHFPLFARTFY